MEAFREQRYEDAERYIDLAIKDYEKRKLTDSVVMAYLQKSDVLWATEGSDAALKIAKRGIEISNSLPEKNLSRVGILSKAGQILVNVSRFSEGKKYLDKALMHIPEGEEENNIVAKLYTHVSWYYLTQDEFANAADYAGKSLKIQKALFGNDGRQLMGAYQSLSLIEHGAGNYQKAEAYGLELLRIAEMHLDENHPNLGLVHSGLGTIYETIRKYDQALYHFTRMMQIMQNSYKESGNPQMPAIAFNNLAMVYKSIGEFTLAEFYYEKGLELNKLSMGEEVAGIIRPLTDLADTKREVGKYHEADSLYNLSYNLQQKIDKNDDIQLAYVETQYGDLHSDKGDYKKAEEFYLKALSRYKRKGIENTEIFLVTINTLAVARAKQGKIKDAITLHRELLEKYKKLHPAGDIRIAGQYNKINESYLLKKDFQKAKIYSDSTFLELLKEKKFPKGNWLLKLPFQINILYYLKNRVIILQELFEKEKQVHYLKEIINLADNYSPYLEAGIPSLRTQASLLRMSEQHGYLYQAALEACWQLHNLEKTSVYLEKAFEFSERSKALILLLATNNILVDASDSVKISGNTDKYWRDKINELNTALLNSRQNNDSILIALNTAVESYKNYQDSLIQSGNKSITQRYSLSPYNIEEIRKQLLQKNQTLIAFEITWKNLYQFVITPDNFEVFQFPLSVLENVSRLSAPYQLSIEEFKKSAYNIYKEFIFPIESKYILGKEIIIIPDQELYDLNFELLPASEKGRNFSELDYLIRRFEFSYQLSATSGVRLKQQPTVRTSKALLFAPVFTDEMKQSYKTRMENSLMEDAGYYHQLNQPFSLQAAHEIIKHINGDLFLEEEANENRFRNTAGQYHILHLGTHAVANNSDPLQSRLVLAKPTPAGEEKGTDGYLHAYEIYGMQFNAHMAVLLACETGKGAFRSGEGVMSLAHSFMHAGCRSVVMSLWKIDDKTSAEIISEFYKNLSNGDSKTTALRKAKLWYLDNNEGKLAHPYYWAGLAILGDAEPVYKKKLPWTWIIGGLLIAGSLIALIKREKINIKKST